ncbi:MAG: hypothetical protein ACI83P_001187 [Janthinobacterium sp.]|jgi:hypothetical protein
MKNASRQTAGILRLRFRLRLRLHLHLHLHYMFTALLFAPPTCRTSTDFCPAKHAARSMAKTAARCGHPGAMHAPGWQRHASPDALHLSANAALLHYRLGGVR